MSRKLIFAMQASLDGYIEGPNGELDWNRVDEQLHRHFNEQERGTEILLYGRRLYELMANYWPFARDDTSLPDYMREYSDIWRTKEKVVFSRSLREVDWNSRLVSGDAVEEVVRLKEEGQGLMSVGGATLAGSLIAAGLVDEFWVYLTPVTLGAGRPMFGPETAGLQLRRLGSHQFDSGVTLLRYERGPGGKGGTGMRFRTTIAASGKTATGIPVPEEVLTELGAGRRPAVVVTVAGHSYRSSVATVGGAPMISLSSENRAKAGLSAGDEVEVELALDTAPREVSLPADFAAALEADQRAAEKWAGLSYSNRRWHVESIEGAKTPETRTRRIERSIAALSAGKPR